jgi:hypothetical protein
MLHNCRQVPSILILLVALMLAACGSEAPAPIPSPEPSPAATATVAPTAEPTAEPTDTPTATPPPTEAAEPTESNELATVEIGSLETYTHSTGLFSMDVPAGWTLTDNSRDDEVIIIWTDPTNNALIGVDIFENSSSVSPEQLIEFLQNFLDNSFGDNLDFNSDPPTVQPDGGIQIAWGYTAQASNGVSAPLIGNSFIDQRGDKISILTSLIPQAQFDMLAAPVNAIINSYEVNPQVAINPDAPATVGALQEVQIGELQNYSHPSGVFSIDLPANWQLSDSSSADQIIQIWTDPTGNAFVSVNIFESESQAGSEELATFLDDYLRETFGDQERFLIEAPVTLDDGSVLIVWGYEAATPVGNVRANLTGNSFIEQRGTKISILTLLLPQAQFDALIDQTNAIINSYRINPDVPITDTSGSR